MANPALVYAESTLGVHAVYEKACASYAELDEITTDLDKAHDRKRNLAEKIADREQDLLIEERGKHASMSGAELERHMKIVKYKDSKLQELKTELLQSTAVVSGLEYDADMAKTSIKISIARMEELGGYFKYLAAIKEAETLTKLTKQENRA